MYRDQVERVAKERKKEIAEALICLPKFRFRRMFDEFESQLEERIRSEQYLLLLHLEDHPVLLPTSKHMDFVRLRSIEIRVVLDHCRAFGLHLMNEKAFQKRYPIMQSENVAFSVARWLFESRAHQLVKTLQGPNIRVDPVLPVSAAYWRHVRHLIMLVSHPEYPKNVATLSLETFRQQNEPPSRRGRVASGLFFFDNPRMRFTRKSSSMTQTMQGNSLRSLSLSTHVTLKVD
eukprot:TRINITY_DN8962_c0_g1_i5.p1 TRINITY_DN8962_c0_g1~~TRINITY_DN8962_c0_g1_i5.p1  ORF type:complete len:233 (+),score=43.95 TRINITY_DN8962_c0_g1_i5:219-917(+)